MNQKRILPLFFVLIFSAIIITAALDIQFKRTNKWESATEINSSNGSLQDFLDNDLLRTNKNSIKDFSAPHGGHNLSEIWVSVNGQEMNFKDAIQITNLCGISNPTLAYLNISDPSHLGTEIEVTTSYDGNTKSLQDAINDGTLVKLDGNWSDWETCSVSGTQIRTCTNPTPFCGGNDCSGPFEQTCDPDLAGRIHTKSQCESEGGEFIPQTSNPYRICPAVCLPMYSKQVNTCTFNLCGSGCGPDNVGTFRTLQECQNAPSYYGPSDNSFCKFSGNSCPSGWTQYQSWSTTSIREEYAKQTPFHSCTRYTTNSHNFANTPQESCYWTWLSTTCNVVQFPGTGCSYISPRSPRYLYAPVTEVGCY